jgi:magnesium-transporting ATPase (P-type)
MLRTFIQVQALSSVLISSSFLIKGNLSISEKDLAKLSKTKWGYNKAVTKNLTTQRANTIVGFVLLLLSFFLQMANLLWPMRYRDLEVSKTGAAIAVATTVMILLIAIRFSAFLQDVFHKNVMKILNKDYPLGDVADL